jgi:hypothetical protein
VVALLLARRAVQPQSFSETIHARRSCQALVQETGRELVPVRHARESAIAPMRQCVRHTPSQVIARNVSTTGSNGETNGYNDARKCEVSFETIILVSISGPITRTGQRGE